LVLVGTIREIAGDPALDARIGPYRFTIWLTAAVASLFGWVVLSYLQTRQERDALIAKPRPDFVVSLGLSQVNVKAVRQSNPNRLSLEPLEEISLYLSVPIFITNRGPLPISLSVSARTQWKNGDHAFLAFVASDSNLRAFDFSGSTKRHAALEFPLNVPPHTSQSGAAGFMVLPSGGHDDLADLGDVVATVTENISEGNTKLTLPGKWDVTP
jgi:hypothetical protein